MATAKSNASGGTGEKSTVRLVLFFACILACIGCVYLLIDFQTSLEPKLSGELILGKVDTVSYQHQYAPVLNFLFEYFGLMSYVSSFMIVYIGYFVCLKPTDIWHIDFYKTGLRIVGFNCLFLGGAALMSRYSDLFNTGAGGLLGDMLNMFCDFFLPHVLSVFLFALLAFSGIAFLCGSSPNRVFERVGEGFFKVLPSRAEQNKAKKQKTTTAPQQDPSLLPEQPNPETEPLFAAAPAAAAAASAAGAFSAHDPEEAQVDSMAATSAPAPAPESSFAPSSAPISDFFATAQQATNPVSGAYSPEQEPAAIPAAESYAPQAEEGYEEAAQQEPQASLASLDATPDSAGYVVEPESEPAAEEPFDSVLRPIDPRYQSAQGYEMHHKVSEEPYYHERDLEHEALLDGLNDPKQAPAAVQDTISQPAEAAASPESYGYGTSNEQGSPDSMGSQDEGYGYSEDGASQEQLYAERASMEAERQDEMASDPSLAPFASNQLYDSQEVIEPMQGNPLESAPVSDLAPMPTMEHRPKVEPPKSPEPFSPYAAYQAEQAQAQAAQALQAYASTQVAPETTAPESSAQQSAMAPLASGQGATLDDVVPAQAQVAAPHESGSAYTGAQAVDDSPEADAAADAASPAAGSGNASPYTEVTAESKAEAEVSPYGYGTYAEQFVGRKRYSPNSNADEEAESGSSTVAYDDAANSAAEGSAEEAKSESADNEVHTIVQRVDPEVFAAQLAAQKKAREEEAKAKAEAEAKEKAEAEAAAAAAESESSEQDAEGAGAADADDSTEGEASVSEAADAAADGAADSDAEADEASDEEDDEDDDTPIYAGTYASHLKQNKQGDKAESDEDDSSEEDDEDEGPQYITPGAPKKPKKNKKKRRQELEEETEAEGDSEESGEESAAPRTIIQDNRKEFEAAQERAKAEAEAKAKEAEERAKAEEEARLAAEAAAEAARLEAEAKAKAEAEAKAKAEEKARLAAEAAEAQAEAEAVAKARAAEEARLAAEAAEQKESEPEPKVETAPAQEAKPDEEDEASQAAKRESKESAILEALSTLASELKSVTDSSLSMRHEREHEASASASDSKAQSAILGEDSTAASTVTAATIAAATTTGATSAGISMGAALASSTAAAALEQLASEITSSSAVESGSALSNDSDLGDSVITSVEVRHEDEAQGSISGAGASGDALGFNGHTNIQRGSGDPEVPLGRPELNVHTTITRGPSVETDNDFLNYAVARNNAQMAGEVLSEPVTVNLFADDLEESKKREQSLYQPQHEYNFGEGQQAGAIDSSLSGASYSDNSDGVDDFVTGATHSSNAPVRTQHFNFAELAQKKAAAAAAAAAQGAATSSEAVSPAAGTSAAESSTTFENDASSAASISGAAADANIIAFNKFGAHEPHTYEVGDLTPAFIPMPSEEQGSGSGHISSGDLNNLYEQGHSEDTTADGSTPSAEGSTEATETAATELPATSSSTHAAEEAETSDAPEVEDESAEEEFDSEDEELEGEAEAEDDEEYYDEEDSEDSEEEDDSEAEVPASAAPAAASGAGAVFNQNGMMSPMMNMPQGVTSAPSMYQTMPNGQQMQYMQLPNGQYVPVMGNGMMYPNMPMSPMGNMPMQAMPQFVQLANGQYVPVMPNAQNMVYPQMSPQVGMVPNVMGAAPAPAQTAPAAASAPAPAAAPATPAPSATPAAPAAAAPAAAEPETEVAGSSASWGGAEAMPEVEDHFGDGLPDSAAAMARELMEEDESASALSMRVPDVGVHGATGGGLPEAGNAFMGAHNSSTSNLPSYMAGVPQAPAASFDAPRSLSLCSVPRHRYDEWRPELSLLARSHDHVELSIEELNKTSERINSVLHSFGVKATVADYLTGPVITRFDLELQPGVKSSAIASIEKELCRNLLVSNVRVVPIIDGSSYVGLEVPNPKRKLITLGDMVSTREFQETKASLPMCLGASVVGAPVVKDLAETPHLLVAGTTGSGKSAGLNTMLISLLLKRSPAELRLILVDPKQLEFSIYKDLPHLITPVITDVAEKTPIALNWCVEEMERRFKLMSLLGVRKLSEYNELIRSEEAAGRSVPDPLWTADMGPIAQSLKPLPWIVVVVEEFADLMAQSGRKKDKENTPESLIARLSAKSRAAGIHLVLVTQTPRSEVVTGMIKANFPSRIAFTVQSRLDSTIVLDDKGAETLLGNGDMLYKFTGASSPTRAHGAFTSNDDVKAVVDAWRHKAGAPEYLEDVIAVPEEVSDNKGEEKTKELDVKFDQAVELVRSYMESLNKPPTVTDLQTELGVGYPRAKKIYRQLTVEGIID